MPQGQNSRNLAITIRQSIVHVIRNKTWYSVLRPVVFLTAVDSGAVSAVSNSVTSERTVGKSLPSIGFSLQSPDSENRKILRRIEGQGGTDVKTTLARNSLYVVCGRRS